MRIEQELKRARRAVCFTYASNSLLDCTLRRYIHHCIAVCLCTAAVAEYQRDSPLFVKRSVNPRAPQSSYPAVVFGVVLLKRCVDSVLLLQPTLCYPSRKLLYR